MGEQHFRSVDRQQTGGSRVDAATPLPARIGPRSGEVAAGEARLLARLRGEAPPPDLAPPGPRQIGRYTLLEWLGAGASGRVHAAFDPQLGRRVAIKLLHASLEGTSHHQRLRREAHALARLSHPNVVQVYEIGVHDGRVFLAMELVPGRDLRKWLAESPRSPSEILELYLRAGEGLVAAHAVGLVHRDFKPDNVLVGDDGRPRVADFGLARPPNEAVPSTRSEDDETSARFISDLTASGAVVGTPAYMAPEQGRGEPLTPAADQFSYCVSLYEALYGERPFQLGPRSLLRGTETVRPAPAASTVPRWLREALLRGLRPTPAERWPSMSALLTALRHDPAVARRRRRIRGGALLTAGAVAFAAYRIGRVHPERCEEEARTHLAEAWDPARRAEVEAAVLTSGVAYAPQTWARLAPQLDAYGDRWEQAYRHTCTARPSVVEPGSSTDASLACLEGRRRDLAALVDVLREADATVIEHALRAADTLPAIEDCRDATPSVHATTDAAQRERVEPIQRQLARAHALQFSGKYELGHTVAVAARKSAEALGDRPVLADAYLREAALTVERGDYADSEPMLERAFFGARATGHDPVARDAARLLAQVVGVHLHRHDEGLRWAAHACADAERVDDPLELAACASVRGNVEYARGDYAAAERYHREALAARERLRGREHVVVAQSLQNLGSACLAQARYDDARAAFERALEIRERTLGAEHPEVASTLVTLGAMAFERGDHDAAQHAYARALELHERVLGPHHPDVAAVVLNLGNLLAERGEATVAREHYERAIAVWTAAVGADHPDVALARFNLGNLLARQGHFALAQAQYDQTLAIWEATSGPEHPYMAILLNSLGNLAFEQGDREGALDRYRRALALRERDLGDDNPKLGFMLQNIGTVLTALGDPAQAIEVHTRALALRERGLGPDHLEVAQSLIGLGTARREHGRCDLAAPDYERAIRILEDTLEPDHPDLVAPLFGLSRCSLAGGDPTTALARARRAIAIARQPELPPDDLAELRAVEAEALAAGAREGESP